MVARELRGTGRPTKFKKRKRTLGQKFFRARVVDLWNDLYDSTASVDTVTTFKKRKKWYINHSMVLCRRF